jgi:hypothetical protein
VEIQPSDWPDPNGEKPPDWPADHWTAFTTMMLEERSVRSTADLLGFSPGTISGWQRKYRKRYGPTFWPASRPAGILPPAATSYGAMVAGRSARGGKWAALREGAANQYGEASFLAREAASAALRLLLADEGRLKALAARDILDLAKAAEVLAHRADVLARIPPPNLILANVNNGPAPVSGILAGLDRVPDDADHLGALEVAEAVVRHFQVLNGGEAEAEAS